MSIFIRLAVVAFQMCEIPRNSPQNSNSEHFEVIQGSSILVPIESAYATPISH